MPNHWFRSPYAAPSVLLGMVLAGTSLGPHRAHPAPLPTELFRGSDVPFRGWKTVPLSLPADQAALLEPEAMLFRRYEGAGEWVELAVVAGHRKRTVHSPGFCMAGGGWEPVLRRQVRLPLGRQAVTASCALLERGASRQWVTYFFTDGRTATDDLLRFQLLQFGSRLRGRPAPGALVRLILPARRGEIGPPARLAEFASTVLPSVIGRLRDHS